MTITLYIESLSRIVNFLMLQIFVMKDMCKKSVYAETSARFVSAFLVFVLFNC